MKSELEALVEKMITGGILFEEAVKEFEKQFILRVLSQHGNNLSRAAEELQIHRNTLTKRLQDYEQGKKKTKKNGTDKRRQIPPRHKVRVQDVSR